MNCQDLTTLLPAYLDKELDLVRSLEVEQHLKECPACARRYQEQLALRQVLAGPALYFEAPPELAQRVRRALRPGGQAEARPARRHWDLGGLWLRWGVPAAVLGCLALLLGAFWLGRPSAESRLAQAVVSAHLRSLMAAHLTDVASTNQHTVKPWFNGKVTFSPPVVDLAEQGFPLVGGRLDVVEEQPVAVLVYQRRKHYINLFIWPAQGGSMQEKYLTQRGYNLLHWTEAGMDCWAVSDVNQGELQEFAQLVRAQGTQPKPK